MRQNRMNMVQTFVSSRYTIIILCSFNDVKNIKINFLVWSNFLYPSDLHAHCIFYSKE